MPNVLQVAANSSTLTLNGHVFNDFEAGDNFTVTFQNDLTSHTNGSDGTVTIQGRVDGDVADLVMRLVRRSGDDVFMNSICNQVIPTVINGTIKQNYTRNGVSHVEGWVLRNGSVTARPVAVANDMEGNSLSEYTIKFRSVAKGL